MLSEKLNSGKFLILGEFEPPKGSDFSDFLKNALQVKGRLDAILVPEMENSVLKASSLGGCAFLQQRGFETIMQVCCRDRNRLALQADILSAGALGVENIMVVEGEDIRFGDHPQARTVNDLNMLELVDAIGKIQNGKDMAGIELRGSPKFSVGAALDTGAAGGLLELELEKAKKMIEMGVDFFITNPVFDLRSFQQLLKRIPTDELHLIPKVLLLKSAGMARYINRNIRGISIPEDTIRRIQKAPDKVKECVMIASEIIMKLKEMGVSGVLISTVGWEDKIPLILDNTKYRNSGGIGI